MESLEAALRQKDSAAHIFFAPRTLRAGGYWLPELAKEIAESTAFVLLVGEKGIGRWQVIEYYEAFDRRVKEPNYPVILILHAGQAAPGLPFLNQLHRIVTSDPASEDTIGKLFHAADAAEAKPGELWRYTAPYRGLAAMTESDNDFFFGRERETAEIINVLAGAPDKLPILLGNSGVGKSSLAQAGVLAALLRQGYPKHAANAAAWPQVFRDSRHWCLLTLRPGTEPLRALVEPFLRTWQYEATDPRRAQRQAEWVEALLGGKLGLRDLLDATEQRYREIGQTKPPAFFLYVDQGEELYVRGEERQRRMFSDVIARGLGDPRVHALMSMRADFTGALHNDEPLYSVQRLIHVPPLREAELRDVVSRPAQQLSASFETETLAGDIARRTAEESTKDAGALPLLSYLLDDMWTRMVKRGDGVLRLPMPAIALGGVLVERADAFLARHPDAEDALRRLFTLRLATVRPDGQPMRRRAPRSEFTDTEWLLVSELADHPNRLLVTGTLDSGEAFAEVAHEALFHRWDKLREWIDAEREFLAWRSGLEAARRTWAGAPEASKHDALPMGLALTQAESWLARRSADVSPSDRDFILLASRTARRRRRRVQAVVGALAFGIAAGVIGWLNERHLVTLWRTFTVIRPYMHSQVRPHVLSAEAERALKPQDSFRECAKLCPEMVVIRAGDFWMGSPEKEQGRQSNEGPPRKVVIAKPFAVSKFAVTFEDWDACVAYGDCDPQISDSGFGRGRQPVVNVTWDDAQRYVAWLRRMTGKPYRLLSEAEWEYAARADSKTAYSFGDDPALLEQHGWYIGNSGTKPHPVGDKKPNPWGLYDMHGNVWQWVEDCYHVDYQEAPTDGSARTTSGCSNRVLRGGSWYSQPHLLRSAHREWRSPSNRSDNRGFRIARTLAP